MTARDMTARDTTTLLEVRGVDHRLGQGAAATHVLQGVDLDVGAGEVVALAGRSGSGKSSLCHLVAGIGRPQAGTLLLSGRPTHTIRDWTVLAFLPQRLSLVPELTVEENVGWPCRLAGREAPGTLLADLAIDHLAARPVSLASLGEQQRVGLARALATRPALAVLDEPTGHQDDDNVDRVLAVVRTGAAAGTAVLVATHDERVIDEADRVVRMSQGRAVGGVAATS